MNERPNEERCEDHPPEGPTALLGLFAAPPGGSDEKDSNGDSDLAMKPSEHKKTESLMGLFTPPAQEEIQSYDDMDNATADIHAPAGSVSHMMAMFAPPARTVATKNAASTTQTPPIESSLTSFDSTQPRPELERPAMERQSTAKRSNRRTAETSECTPLLGSSLPPSHSRLSSWKDLFPISAKDSTPKTTITSRKQHTLEIAKVTHARMPSVVMPAIKESQDKPTKQPTKRTGALQLISSFIKTSAKEAMKPTTYIGSFMFLLYHVVFCLALGSAITRPNNPTSILGLMTKTSALGIISGAAVYWFTLSSEIPALYPTVDLFLAPMLAHLAKIVDQTLADDHNVSDAENDTVFLATFGVLSAIGISFSGLIIFLATIFKLANLGSFLVSLSAATENLQPLHNRPYQLEKALPCHLWVFLCCWYIDMDPSRRS
jgi:hypothetical protein